MKAQTGVIAATFQTLPQALTVDIPKVYRPR
jgi:hypothetical protein